MQCAAENRICWRYHRPSIHYYQTINYTESNLINLIGSSWIIFCKQKVPDAIEYNILLIYIVFSILQVTQPYDKHEKWNIHKQHILKIHLWVKIYFHGTVFSMEIINNIVTTCKKKKLSWYFPDTNIWSTWKMDHLIFLFKLHILSYNLIKNLSCVQFYVGYQIKVKLSTWCFTGSKITPYITNQIQIWVAS